MDWPTHELMRLYRQVECLCIRELSCQTSQVIVYVPKRGCGTDGQVE